MRAIKFRCWNMHADTMHSWEVMCKGHKMHLISDQQGSYPVMQFTGLQDKNGVDIYEGDLCSYNGQQPEEVFWIGSGFCTNTLTTTPYWADSVVVIGNIHQDAELLENK